LGAFVFTWLRVEWTLPLMIAATALDRYRFDVAGAGLRVEHFVFLGIVLAWVLKMRPSAKQFHFTRADLLLVLFLGVTLLSSVWNAPLARESLKFFGLMCYGVVLFWFVRAAGAHAHAFTRAVWALIVVGVSASAFGIFAWLVFPLGINLGVQTYSLGTFETFSAYGILYDSNTLGMFAMAAALLQMTLLLDARFAQWRIALSAGVVVTLLAVALSLTRTAWLGLAVGLFLIFVFSPRRRWVLVFGGAALALVVGALLANSVLAGGGGALADFSVTRLLTAKSIFFRLDAYARAWQDFLANPLLGNGANTFAQKYTAPSGTRDWISNVVLMSLHDTGIVGMALLGGWLIWLGVATWRALKISSPRRPFLLALAIAYAALLVCYQATSVFWLGWNWIYLGLLAAGQLAVTHQAESYEN
jgi:O-antigen ligase